jgi:broad specificity phosphatase PhoE
MLTRVYFIRHARTDWNAAKRLQGHTDRPLDATGRAQFEGLQLPQRLAQLPCMVSPLLRTQQSAALLGFEHPQIVPALLEMDWGCWEGRRLSDLRAELGAEMTRNEDRGLDFRPDGGETPRAVAERVVQWLHELAMQPCEVVAVAHKGVIRAVLARAWGWDMRGKPPVQIDWHRVHEVTIDGRGPLRAGELNIALTKRSESGE